MRNASDIFCLNEDGTDGMQMFSVSGNCPMRIKRRNQHRENDCFEYGRQTMNPEQMFAKGDVVADKLESGEKSYAEEAVTVKGNETDLEILHSLESQTSHKSDDKKDSELQFHKLNKSSGSKEEVTTSTITRNPLTGAGMEIKEHRKPKKGLKHLNDRWVW